MIDGIKITCTGVEAHTWQNNPCLDFGAWLSEATGEITATKKAKHKHLTFTITASNTCMINGSLHKYYHDSNHADYYFTEIVETIRQLQSKFHINPQTAAIHALEIGVNITLPYTPDIIIKSIICHKNKPFNILSVRDKIHGVVCEYTDYTIKFYNKQQFREKKMQTHIHRYSLTGQISP